MTKGTIFRVMFGMSGDKTSSVDGRVLIPEKNVSCCVRQITTRAGGCPPQTRNATGGFDRLVLPSRCRGHVVSYGFTRYHNPAQDCQRNFRTFICTDGSISHRAINIGRVTQLMFKPDNTITSKHFFFFRPHKVKLPRRRSRDPCREHS